MDCCDCLGYYKRIHNDRDLVCMYTWGNIILSFMLVT